MKSKTSKWSAEWLASATLHALQVAFDVASANAIYTGDTRGSKRTFLWSSRAEAVREEIAKRTGKALLEKLSPARLKLSAKMRWIIDSVTGQDNGARGPRGEEPLHLSITSDGFVTAGQMFIGDYSDLKQNLDGVLATIEATTDERIVFWAIYKQHVTDWRS